MDIFRKEHRHIRVHTKNTLEKCQCDAVSLHRSIEVVMNFDIKAVLQVGLRYIIDSTNAHWERWRTNGGGHCLYLAVAMGLITLGKEHMPVSATVSENTLQYRDVGHLRLKVLNFCRKQQVPRDVLCSMRAAWLNACQNRSIHSSMWAQPEETGYLAQLYNVNICVYARQSCITDDYYEFWTLYVPS